MKKKKVDYGYQVSLRDLQLMTAATMKKMNEKYPKLFYAHMNSMLADRSLWIKQASTRIYHLVADEGRLHKNPKDSELLKSLFRRIIREEFWTKDTPYSEDEMSRAIKNDARCFDENPFRRERDFVILGPRLTVKEVRAIKKCGNEAKTKAKKGK